MFPQGVRTSILRIVSNEAPAFDALGSSREQSDLDLLHAITKDLIAEQDSGVLHGKIFDAANAITRSQFGTMQLHRPSHEGAEGGLKMLISRGLTPADRAVWQWVTPQAYSSCTEALRLRRRVIIPDYESWDEIAATEDPVAFRRAGIRSAQTTPLLSRNGMLLGMISTYWSVPHEPSERDLRMLDILARQAADLLGRTIGEEALRVREKQLQDTGSRTCSRW